MNVWDVRREESERISQATHVHHEWHEWRVNVRCWSLSHQHKAKATSKLHWLGGKNENEIRALLAASPRSANTLLFFSSELYSSSMALTEWRHRDGLSLILKQSAGPLNRKECWLDEVSNFIADKKPSQTVTLAAVWSLVTSQRRSRISSAPCRSDRKCSVKTRVPPLPFSSNPPSLLLYVFFEYIMPSETASIASITYLLIPHWYFARFPVIRHTPQLFLNYSPNSYNAGHRYAWYSGGVSITNPMDLEHKTANCWCFQKCLFATGSAWEL